MLGLEGARPETAAGPGAPRARYLRQFELVERVKGYDPSADEALINRAYVYATKMHGSQKRHSGDPYFAHPIEVAGILTEYRLDTATIVAGLLHDTIEDTAATREEIVHLFGDQVAELVEGVTKLSKIEAAAENETQAANLQKFILATSKDIRVLLVKLADRLHNMRTIGHLPKPEKRRRIALETLEIYAPLARRIGMDRMAGELEELAFAEAFPEARATIVARLDALSELRADTVERVTRTLSEILKDARIEARTYGRRKQPYSIWRKLQRKSVQFSDLADIIAFRVVVADVDECYRALGLVHLTWRAVPEQFEDYISNPKPNGYQSIHTTVVGPGNIRVEVQIRTEEMDEYAEFGVAAHWRYKNESYGFDAEGARKTAGIDPREAVRSLLEIAAHRGDPDEFLEHAKLEMYQDHVFAFTPKGQLIALPLGATPLDFAYAVHSDIGDTTMGARINGEEKPLRTQLANGDVVEVIRADRRASVPGWQSLTKTGRAKSAQRRLERHERREEFVKLGRQFVAAALRRFGHDVPEVDLEEVAQRLGHRSEDDLLAHVGDGTVRPLDVCLAAFPGLAEQAKQEETRAPIDPHEARLHVQGPNLPRDRAVSFGQCCSPIPGDRIVGVEDGGEIVVHTIDCERLAALEGDPEWLDLAWTEYARQNALAVGRIRATIENGRGILAQLAKIVSESEGDILNVRTVRRQRDFVDVIFDIEVADSRRLTHILAAMRSARSVRDAERVRGDQ